MQDETPAEARVFVVEQQAFDYSPASAYGKLEFLSSIRLAPDAPSAGNDFNSKVLYQLRRELSDYVAGIDYIIPTGSPVKMLVVGAVLRDKGNTHNVLGWDARTQRYLHYVIVV